MSTSGGRHVFLSASFPSGERGRDVEPYDADAIADAVTAVVRAVLLAGGRLLFGGHPTVTPLVLSIGHELHRKGKVDIFQSRWFEAQITDATRRLTDWGIGALHWTPRLDSEEASLKVMREQMFAFTHPAGAVFVGGMDGIYKEYEQFGRSHPGVPRLPLRGPGGAAARLPLDHSAVPARLWDHLHSRQYPFVASLIVEALGVTEMNRPEPESE